MNIIPSLETALSLWFIHEYRTVFYTGGEAMEIVSHSNHIRESDHASIMINQL